MTTADQIETLLNTVYEIIKIVFEFLVTVESLSNGTYVFPETETTEAEQIGA